MKLVTVKQMRRLEEEAIKKIGLPDTILMENAGRGVAEIIARRFGASPFKGQDRRALILVGGGNNGGDGLVVGRHLYRLGWEVELLIAADPERFPPAARQNWLAAKKLGLSYRLIKNKTQINDYFQRSRKPLIIVDALLGIGFRGRTQGLVKDVIEAVNGLPAGLAKVISVDLPSGLEADTGKPSGSCIKAFLTVTLGLPKAGLLKRIASPYVGRLEVADIGLPLERLKKAARKSVRSQKIQAKAGVEYLTAEMIAPLVPPRPVTAHKGSSGKIFILAGSAGMAGAAILAARAALRTGAGLVYLGLPKTIAASVNAALPEAIVVPLPPTDRGSASLAALPKILEWAGKVDALAIGPGLSTDPQTQELVRQIFLAWLKNKNRVPLVIDADGLNALAAEKDLLSKATMTGAKPLILTPHPGEMGRLLGMTAGRIEADRWNVAKKAAKKWACQVILKGAGTVIAAPSGKLFINSTGNPALATGGTGDVLTGIIVSLLGQGLDPLAACQAGVYLHGLCADLFAVRKGERGLLASDLIEIIPEVLNNI